MRYKQLQEGLLEAESQIQLEKHVWKMQAEVFTVGRPCKAQKKEPLILTFTNEDEERVLMPHNDPLVITLTVANYGTHQILVDNGNSTDILYWPTFEQMKIGQERIKPV